MAVIETSAKTNPAGVYKHPETGAEVVAKRHPKFGLAQADGYVAAGYVFVRDAKDGEEGVLKTSSEDESNTSKLQPKAVQADAKRVVEDRAEKGAKK